MTSSSPTPICEEAPTNAFDAYCSRCGFDKRWPAHNCDHRQMSILGRNTARLLQRPLVLDGLYSPYSWRKP
jgi:hypothetical protein